MKKHRHANDKECLYSNALPHLRIHVWAGCCERLPLGVFPSAISICRAQTSATAPQWSPGEHLHVHVRPVGTQTDGCALSSYALLLYQYRLFSFASIGVAWSAAILYPVGLGSATIPLISYGSTSISSLMSTFI